MRFKNRRLILLSSLTVVMALSMMFAVPSGSILASAAQSYQDVVVSDWEDESANAWDQEIDESSVQLIASTGLTDVILATNDISYLSVDIDEIGREPIEENFTETGYSDETIIVEIEEVYQDDSTYHVAYVKIATPTQLRTAIAGDFGSSRTYKPTVFSASYNAIVLINGDYYTNTLAGYIVRQGVTYREKTSANMDLLLIDENSDFHIITRGKDNQAEAISEYLEEHEIINGFFFGPGLVIDGEVQEIDENYQFNPFGDEPRSAIGQIGPLTYALVTVDGRIDESDGVTMEELANFMKQIGCEQAYGLDGGNSSALVFNNELISVKDVSERDISDVIYFATAIDN